MDGCRYMMLLNTVAEGLLQRKLEKNTSKIDDIQKFYISAAMRFYYDNPTFFDAGILFSDL